jgi:hypothetical protein
MRAADVSLDGVRVGVDSLVGAKDQALPLVEQVVDFATALVCAEAVGAIKYACDGVEYPRRAQFGADRQLPGAAARIVDMVISGEQARSMANLACTDVDTRAIAQAHAHGSGAHCRRVPARRRNRFSCTAAWDDRGEKDQPQLPAMTMTRAVRDADHLSATGARLTRARHAPPRSGATSLPAGGIVRDQQTGAARPASAGAITSDFTSSMHRRRRLATAGCWRNTGSRSVMRGR